MNVEALRSWRWPTNAFDLKNRRALRALMRRSNVQFVKIIKLHPEVCLVEIRAPIAQAEARGVE